VFNKDFDSGHYRDIVVSVELDLLHHGDQDVHSVLSIHLGLMGLNRAVLLTHKLRERVKEQVAQFHTFRDGAEIL